jgi:signal transduction histidine kinase
VGVRQWRTALRHAVGVGRRFAAAPGWPLSVAVQLALLASLEATRRGAPSAADASTGLLLALCATAPVAFMRTHVLPAAATATAATFMTVAGGLPVTAAGVVAVGLLLYQLARRRPRPAALVLLLPYIAYAIWAPLGLDDRGRIVAGLLLTVAVAAVTAGAVRRARAETLERDASRREIESSLLEHAARGERARIARELHDVVAHHISMIAVQAETARLTTPGMPSEGARRLVAIGDTARAALTEMRRLLGVLREDAGTEPTRNPQPGLEQLVELLDEARESTGMSARLIVHGPVGTLDPGVELTAYRIVQEALTNARRHAPGAAVDVELAYGECELRVRVRDNGPGPPDGPAPAGHGLLGMRERAATVGGTLVAGPGRLSGFVVEAVLPTAKAAA